MHEPYVPNPESKFGFHGNIIIVNSCYDGLSFIIAVFSY